MITLLASLAFAASAATSVQPTQPRLKEFRAALAELDVLKDPGASAESLGAAGERSMARLLNTASAHTEPASAVSGAILDPRGWTFVPAPGGPDDPNNPRNQTPIAKLRRAKSEFRIDPANKRVQNAQAIGMAAGSLAMNAFVVLTVGGLGFVAAVCMVVGASIVGAVAGRALGGLVGALTSR